MRTAATWLSSTLARRMFPLLATVGLAAVGMAATTAGAPLFAGTSAWSLPQDLWGTLVAAQRLLHGDLAGLYTQPTGLVSFPGAAVILVPVAALIDAVGLSLQFPGPHNPQPAVWLLACPYQVVLSGMALVAADALADHLGVPRSRRVALTAAEAVALWNVSVGWGHPEDAVAVGLLLYGILALARDRGSSAGWLMGGAVAVQPLVLLALPIILAALPPRRWGGFLVRTAAPAMLLVAAAAAANWTATVNAVTSQPNWPSIDHPTPWMFLAPRLGDGTVAAGPGRALAVLVACGGAAVAGRRWRLNRRPSVSGPGDGHGPDPRGPDGTDTGDAAVAAVGPGGPGAGWSREFTTDLLWWVAAALALRCVFESVMVAYYLWPALAVALLAATASWSRLLATSLLAAGLTVAAQAPWRGRWTWWAAMIGGLCLAVTCARLSRRSTGRSTHGDGCAPATVGGFAPSERNIQ